MLFILSEKLFSLSRLSRYLNFYLDQRDKVNFKIYDVTTWLTNNDNTYLAEYLTKQRQSDIEIWSGSRI